MTNGGNKLSAYSRLHIWALVYLFLIVCYLLTVSFELLTKSCSLWDAGSVMSSCPYLLAEFACGGLLAYSLSRVYSFSGRDSTVQRSHVDAVGGVLRSAAIVLIVLALTFAVHHIRLLYGLLAGDV